MWMHWDALYSPWLSFWNPISWYMFSPWTAALASTNGLGMRADRRARGSHPLAPSEIGDCPQRTPSGPRNPHTHFSNSARCFSGRQAGPLTLPPLPLSSHLDRL